jgi:hypothetical protein
MDRRIILVESFFEGVRPDPDKLAETLAKKSVVSSSLILMHSNTIQEIESVAKRCPKNLAMFRRLVSSVDGRIILRRSPSRPC